MHRRQAYFKSCAMCGTVWPNREHFLSDDELKLIGYQPNFDELALGLFLFNHSCGTTLGLHAGEFLDLYRGAVVETPVMNLHAKCPGYCSTTAALAPCPVRCPYAYVRELTWQIANWPKRRKAIGE